VARKLEVGVGIWSMQSTKTGPRHFSKLYAELVEDAQWCEELGTIHALWQTEHHFWYDGYCPALLTVAGAIASATRHLRIGQSALLFAEHDPLRVATQAAALDQLSAGRLELGLALGYREAEFDGFDLDRRHRRRRMDEGLAAMRRLWGEAPAAEDEPAAAVRPLQRPLPIWIGAVSAPPVVRAAKLGASVILSDALGLELVREYVELYRRTAEEHGVDTSTARMGVLRRGWVAETDDEAAREALPSLRFLLREQLGGWRYLVDDDGVPVGFDRPRELDAAAARTVAVHERTVGRPERVLRGLREIAATGCDYVIFGTRFDSLPRAKFLRSLELLATEVIPHVNG
jgi:alkanesulfonate monooxygenase SsuD/methylene tetrahydromethanopterin reductase-like flavin-dependent oxidoreductase (luciferase family)